jgi:hypothetical protein
VRKREHVSLGKLLGQRDEYACKLPKAIVGLVEANVKEVVGGKRSRGEELAEAKEFVG